MPPRGMKYNDNIGMKRTFSESDMSEGDNESPKKSYRDYRVKKSSLIGYV